MPQPAEYPPGVLVPAVATGADAASSAGGTAAFAAGGGAGSAAVYAPAEVAAAPLPPEPSLADIMRQIQHMQMVSAQQIAIMTTSHQNTMQRLHETLTKQHDETKQELQSLQMKHDELATVLTGRVEAIEARLAKYESLEQGFDDRFKTMQATLKQQLLEELRGSKGDILRPPAVQPGERPRFIAARIFLRGFCDFGAEATQGISKAQAKTIVDGLFSHLDRSITAYFPASPRHYYTARFRSSQIVLTLRDTVQQGDAEYVTEQLNEAIRAHHMAYLGRSLFAVAEKELWKRIRNAALIKAANVIANHCTVPPNCHIEKAWADGTLFAVVDDHTYPLGTWKNDSWAWNEASLRALWPSVQAEDLSLAYDALGRR
jgi:exonuclease VII large subunit